MYGAIYVLSLIESIMVYRKSDKTPKRKGLLDVFLLGGK